MARLSWRVECDSDGVVWNDLLDADAVVRSAWVITYREYYGSWHVMWNPTTFQDRSDQLINKNIAEEQLRRDLEMRYLLLRDET